jgi:hypothetical protein
MGHRPVYPASFFGLAKRPMSPIEILLNATERFEAAETAVRVAEIRLNHLAPGTPLRYGVEATARLRAATAELEAARVAYDAAQDLPAPEDWE